MATIDTIRDALWSDPAQHRRFAPVVLWRRARLFRYLAIATVVSLVGWIAFPPWGNGPPAATGPVAPPPGRIAPPVLPSVSPGPIALPPGAGGSTGNTTNGGTGSSTRLAPPGIAGTAPAKSQPITGLEPVQGPASDAAGEIRSRASASAPANVPSQGNPVIGLEPLAPVSPKQ